METVYDWVSIAIFAGLIVLFISRATSDNDEEASQSIVPYLLAGVGCAVGNYLGNAGQDAFAVLVLGGTLIGVFHFLHPLKAWTRS